MTDTTLRMVEAEAAQAAWDRFVGPAVAAIREQLSANVATLAKRNLREDRHRDAIQYLGVRLQALDEIEGEMRSLMVDARLAANDAARQANQQQMTPEQRRWAGY